MQQGKVLQSFLEDFNSKPIDVLSLAEVRAIVDSATKMPEGEGLTATQSLEIKGVLRTIEEQAQFISNERRSQLTIGEFITNHHYMNTGSLMKYSNKLLKA